MLTETLILAAVFLAWLWLSVERDYETRRLSDYPYGTPEHTAAQKRWHSLGGFSRAILGGFMVWTVYGFSTEAVAVYLNQIGVWWLLFDILYNRRTGKSWDYYGEFAKTDVFAISVARWLKNKLGIKTGKQFIPLALKLAFIILTGLLIHLL